MRPLSVESVKLTKCERDKLTKIMRNNSVSMTVKKRAQILRQADKQELSLAVMQSIASKVGTCVNTVRTTIRKYNMQGMKAALKMERSVNSDNSNRKVDARAEAVIIKMACSDPPKGRCRWTLRLLEDQLRVELEVPVGKDAIARVLNNNELHPHKKECWVIPKENDADFVAHMEDVLNIYERPYDPDYPVICMDEKPFQLLGDRIQPLPMRPGFDEKYDEQYERMGTCCVLMAVEPKGGFRYVEVRERRTAYDWAEFMKEVESFYPHAKKIILVCDNLNTHTPTSFYKTFLPHEAFELAHRFEFHFTPKHGSWLDIAEIELNVITRECLDRRLPTLAKVREECTAWMEARNNERNRIVWEFTAHKARTKLARLYPVPGRPSVYEKILDSDGEENVE